MLTPGADYRHATYAKDNYKVKSILDNANEENAIKA
jgi:hypothetical protein